MLDLRFKNLCLVYTFVDWKEGVSIVDKYDRKTLYPMLLKCYHHLHPMIESIGCVDQTSDEDSNLEIFTKLHSQMNHQMNLSPRNYWFSNVAKWIPIKTSSVLFNVGKREVMFPTVDFLAHQILGIVRS
jgi:hypothetical protein